MDFKKNKKMIVLTCVTGVICIILLIFSSSVKKKRTSPSFHQPATEQTENNVKSVWDAYDKAQSPISEGSSDAGINPFGEQTESEPDISSLSIYPSPSYVSPAEDTVIYKKGIYKRVGFVKEEPEIQDTIYVEGRAYLRISQLLPSKEREHAVGLTALDIASADQTQ